MYIITVYKKQRRLQLDSGKKTILICDIGLGPAPIGRKTCEGDGKTPEGRYLVCTRNAQSKYTLFLGLNYPSPTDAMMALEQGIISKSQLESIRESHCRSLRPPWHTPLGGQIGIHGGGVEANGILTDNTAGCIALHDHEIKKLWTFADIGTPVIILP